MSCLGQPIIDNMVGMSKVSLVEAKSEEVSRGEPDRGGASG